jgi:hypothetical protein
MVAMPSSRVDSRLDSQRSDMFKFQQTTNPRYSDTGSYHVAA